jgi:hypothetical protein
MAVRGLESMEKCSLHAEGEQEALRHKWIESERAGRDLGEACIQCWVQEHWNGFLRSRWLKHLQGETFYYELEGRDFGLLQKRFCDKTNLLNQILNRLIKGQENLDVIVWSIDTGLPFEPIHEILEALDINSRRLSPRFARCP